MRALRYATLLVSVFLLVWIPISGRAERSTCDNQRLCGPNCMLVICNKLGVNADIQELITLCGTNERGSTLTGLTNAAKAKGLEAEGMKIGVNELAALKTPAIAHQWGNHFVVVERDGAGSLRVSNPPAEPVAVSAADFGKTYSGFALLIAKDKALFPKADTKGPDLRADSYTWNFGAVEDGNKLEHVFTCGNVGNEDLVISKVDSSCGCTAASVGQDRIAPGAKGEIKVAFDTNGKSGAQNETVYVYSNDPITPIAQLQVVGLVSPSRLVYTPKNVDFGEVRREQNPNMEIIIKDSEARRVEVGKVSSDIPFLTTNVVEDAERGRHVIKLALRASEAPLGIFNGNLTIQTNHPKDQTVTVPITGTIKGDIDIFPDILFFGIVKKGNAAQKTIRLSSAAGKPFKIKSVRSSTKSVKTRVVSKVSGKSYEVIGTLGRKTAIGFIKSEITIHTDDAQQREIRIPVYALVED